MIDEIAQMQKQDEIIYNSMFWSYMIVTKQATLENILERDEDFGLIFNPDDIDFNKNFDFIDIIDVLVEYFIEHEEYEKCQDLIDAKKLYTKKK
tara:strand:- start:407 stop:688 length:282 start_codon:yes stop_codon:yes gene_type:complete